ncbi:ABC transporter permease [Saccharicrinis sp. FJH2]|uniref:ABC transporter permease n=1 Tax=unclassified Saccharicrinis TaxID=2646859 RepID=UPI0035D4BC57
MNKIWIIAKRELRSFFDSLMAYIMIILFLGFTGFFTWISGSDIFFINQASLGAFFNIAYWSLFFFIPMLTMRLLAEEQKTGTIELLLTKDVSDWQVVAGKFLSTFLLIAITLALTIPYYITVANLGQIDHGEVWSGYLGLLLMSAAYISIGIFASSLTNNQIVAILIALAIGILFHIIFGFLTRATSGMTAEIFNYLDLNTHYESITRGVIDSKDIIYFLTLIFGGLVAAESMLAKRSTN